MKTEKPRPLVACIMLVDGRHEMVTRAIRSVISQDYQPRMLIILDSGEEPIPTPTLVGAGLECFAFRYRHMPSVHGSNVGTLRNYANAMAGDYARSIGQRLEYFAHFDSDDWSAPGRLTEQVSYIETVGKDAVGYREMLFWDTSVAGTLFGEGVGGRAWMYRYPDDPRRFVGGSMLYRVSAWLACHFHPSENHEDSIWFNQNSHRCYGMWLPDPPKMICSIHGGNISEAYSKPRELPYWARTPDLDVYCRERMAL